MYVGTTADKSHALFRDGENAVVISMMDGKPMAYPIRPVSDYNLDEFTLSEVPADRRVFELALEVFAAEELQPTIASQNRSYQIPRAVQRTATSALSEFSGIVDAVSMDTAALLAKGGPIKFDRIRYIDLYFQNAPEGDNDWQLWGGHAARTWSRKIMQQASRERAEATVLLSAASADETLPGDGEEARIPEDIDNPDIPHYFQMGIVDPYTCGICGRPDEDPIHIDDSTEEPVLAAVERSPELESILAEFEAWTEFDTIILNSTDDIEFFVELDADYPEIAHAVYAELPTPDLDSGDYYKVWSPSDNKWVSSSELIGLSPCDNELASEIATLQRARFQQGQDTSISLADLMPEEYMLFQEAYEDPEFLEEVEAAALVSAGEKPVTDPTDEDDQYSPQERSQNASKQVRDRMGRFAKGGSRVVTANGDRGTISKINPQDQTVTVKTEDGEEIEVPAKEVQRTKGVGKARLGAPPKHILTPEEIQNLLVAFEAYVQRERAKKGLKASGDEAELADQQAVPKGSSAMTPDTSDVKPMMLAVVDDFDKTAVLDLLALVPASSTSTRPVLYRREPNKWVKDDKMLQDLQGVTPPSVTVLEDSQLKSIMKQIDSETIHEAFSIYGTSGELLAAGGLDRNRGKAERLRRYWKFGPGAAKIRWGTPGDWTRCYRQLSKHMGPRAKGYCSLRHKEMNGYWPGDKRNRRGLSVEENMALTAALEEAFIDAAEKRAEGYVAPKTTDQIQPIGGGRFRIPILVPENIETGDGRIFDPMSVSVRDLPIPLLWQIKTGDGHDGSVLVGRIDEVKRVAGGIGDARGVFDTGQYGREAERLVRSKFLRGVSADLDQFEASSENEDDDSEAAGKKKKDDEDDEIVPVSPKIRVSRARVMAATLVPKPAFQQCSIEIDDEEPPMIADGTYVANGNDSDTEALLACAAVAARVPVHPPREWFSDRGLTGPTPLTATDDGQVFGHIATWETDHVGLPFSTKPPRSASNYNYFHTGVLRTAENQDVTVGQLTLAGGHAPLNADAAAAVRHYDDTASAIADVHVGEDAYGIWAAGALRPDVTPEQIRALRASAPSGDWRPINGRLELVAICQVNVPGFPVTRAQVASGKVYALVAAGSATLAKMRHVDLDLTSRVMALEADRTRELEEKRAALSARVKVFDDDDAKFFSAYSSDTREAYAKQGIAMADGSYPIKTVQDLKTALQVFGRGTPAGKPAIKNHIKKRARALGKTDLLPESWKPSNATPEELAAERDAIIASVRRSRSDEIRERFRSMAVLDNGEALFRDYSGEQREAYAKQGIAMKDGSYPIKTVQDLKNAIQAFGRAKDKAAVKRHIKKRARALGKTDLLPESWNLASASAEELAAERQALITTIHTLTLVDEELPEDCPPEELALRFKRKFNEKRHPRDVRGRFRKVLFRLRDDLDREDVEDTGEIIARIDSALDADERADEDEAKRLAEDVIHMTEDVAGGLLDEDASRTLREGYAGLSEAVSAMRNLPFGQDADKLRFSDLPGSLQSLIDDLLSRLQTESPELYEEHSPNLVKYKAGGDYMSQPEIQAELSKLLSLLI